MIITVRTKQYLTLALLLAAVGFVAAAYLLVQVRVQGQELEANLATIRENNAKAATFARVERQVNESSREREAIAAAFLQSEDQGPDFLTTLEGWGKEFGLDVQVQNISSAPSAVASDKKEVMVKFAFTGSKTDVLAFIQLLEALPYHARLESLTLGKGGADTFSAEVDLRIMVYPKP